MLSFFLQGWRCWKHTKGIELLAVLALALGVGATPAICTVVQAVLLNPLPFANPDRYLSVHATWRGIAGGHSAWSYPNCSDFAQQSHTLNAFGCVAYRNYDVVLAGQAVHVYGIQVYGIQVYGIQVSPSIVNVLGIKNATGQMGILFRTDLTFVLMKVH